MPELLLPDPDEMWRAFVARDASYDGVFLTAVRTTGIFCRPSCPARKPVRRNVRFFATSGEALFEGYRPCRRCRPTRTPGATPGWLTPVLASLEADPGRRWRDADLREHGLAPERVRRWFVRTHGITFHAWQRGLRLGRALRGLKQGGSVTTTAFENGWESLSAFQDALRALTGESPGRSRGTVTVRLARADTPLGPMIVGVREEGLALLEFTDRRMLETQLERLEKRLDAVLVPGDDDTTERVREQLDQYFAGVRREFELPLAPAGTAFQQEAWRALTTIPYGETRSYAQQAAALGRPQAIRAVARANGDNPVSIVVPCHRVIGSDGKLTGYGGGLWRKQRLLELERGERPEEA